MISSRTQQSGAVLLIALVILAVTTLLGVAVMQGATLESKMAVNTQERQQAFNAAEAALRSAEAFISNVGFNDASLRDNCTPAPGQPCFTANCANGLCFAGTFTSTDSQDQCLLVPAGNTPPANGPWADPSLNVWTTAGRNITLTPPLPGYGAVTSGRYIIEFRCFTDSLPDAFGNRRLVTGNVGDVVYRITARGTSKSGRVEAMVQSTYRAPKPL